MSDLQDDIDRAVASLDAARLAGQLAARLLERGEDAMLVWRGRWLVLWTRPTTHTHAPTI